MLNHIPNQLFVPIMLKPNAPNNSIDAALSYKKLGNLVQTKPFKLVTRIGPIT